MNNKSQIRLIIFLVVLFLSAGIVVAVYAFPSATGSNTVLNAQACNTGSNSASSGAFTGACTTTNLNLNDGTTQTSATNNNNRYAGINMSSYNSSIVNCGSISNVKLCYEWWYNNPAITLSTCTIKVDANGSASYSTVSTSCPSVTANPGETCIDVTSSESWTCSNFFTASGTRALASLAVLFSNSKTLSIDSFYFNVTYTNDNVSPSISILYPTNTTYTSLPLTLNTSISDTNLQTCWWSNNSGTTNRTFTCNTNVTLGNNVSSGSNTLKVWANDSYGNNGSGSVSFTINFPPTITNATANPNPVAGSTAVTIYANTTSSGVNDSEANTLYLYCDDSVSPDSVNTECTGGTASSAYPYNLTCGFISQSGSGNYTKYCRVYDGNSYSSAVQVNYTVNANVLVTSVVSVAGDTIPSYYDTNGADLKTDILVLGESGMLCRWSSSDLVYSSMVNNCPVTLTQANCSVTDALTQGFITRYVSCKNSLGNEQTTSNNLDVSFYLDYTSPTTSDNSVSSVQLPGYSVTITEADNVDSDPKTYYCVSTTEGCTPATSVDNGGQIVFNTRGANYLRYYSVDFAGNNQTIVNKTININRIPILTSASDNAVTIAGGTSVTVSSVSSDVDSQTLKLYVCNSSGANFSGCTGTQYCSATATSNLSCGFASETDTASHTWYAYLYDSLNESASANPLTGSYTTDSTGPVITIANPSNISYTQTSVTADIMTSETTSSAWYNLDSNITANVSLSNISSVQWTAVISGLSVGSHHIVFYANDSFGNIGSSSTTYFTIASAPDTSVPAITIVSPLNASYNNATSVLINITADESLNWAGYKIDSGILTNLSSSSLTNWNTTLSLADESSFNLTVYANDTSNNQNNKSIVFYTDSLAPRYSSVSASPNPSNQSQDVNCSINWTDGFNITSVKISENSLGSQENHTISFSGISGLASYLILGSKLANKGTYSCIFYATDSAGNSNSTTQSFIVNDVIAPTVTVTSPTNGGVYNQLTVPLSLITSEAAFSAWYSINNSANVTMTNTSTTNWNSTFTGTSVNTYSIVFWANDSSGNVGTSGSKTFTVDTGGLDTIPPVIVITNIANVSYKNLTGVALNITTNENASSAKYSLNSSANVTMTNTSMVNWNVILPTLAQESTNTLVAYANDTAGNNGTTSITFYADTLAPRFISVSANPSVANETQNVNCSVYVNDTFGFNSVKISENATISGTFLNHSIDLFAEGWANYTILNVAKGNYTCIFYATDSAGNSNSTTQSFVVNDVTSPIISINSPLNQTYTTNSILLSISSSESLSAALYSFNNGATNTSLTGSGISWSAEVTKIDGSYTVVFYGNDSSNNLGIANVTFYVDVSVYDTSTPLITVWSPANNSYDIDGDVLLNISSNEALAWAGYTNNSGPVQNLGNISTTSWNSTITLAEGQHNIIFYANDTSTNKNQGNKLVVVYVDLTNPSVSSFSCADANDSQNVNCTASVTDAVGLDYAIISDNFTGSWQNSSQLDLSGLSSSVSYIILEGNTTPGIFSSQIYLFDLSGRLNSSTYDSVTLSDDTSPQINSVIYSPNTTDALDPVVEVKVNATIVEDYNISSVVLDYRNSSASSWTSVTMTNNSVLVDGNESNVIYNASFTPQTETWIFRINATDFAGNSNISSNTTIAVANESSFWNSTTIPLIKSFTSAQRSDNNTLGTIYINNTGDNSLDFNLSISASSPIEGKFDINYTNDDNATYTVSSNENISLTLLINTTGINTGLYPYNISIVSAAGTTVYEKQVYLQALEKPYLQLSVDTYSSSVTTSQTGVEYVVSVTNLGTQDASNVVLNWNLPSIFTLASGSLTRSFSNLPIGVSGTNSITVDVGSSTSDIAYYINATATSSNADSVNTSKSIMVSNPVTITNTITNTVSTGGGGGGGASKSESVVYSKVIEIVRGEENTFDIEVYNKYTNSTLENITLSVTGFLSQYITISPSSISTINPKETKKFTVKLKVPSYKESYEEYTLKAVIIGKLLGSGSLSSYTETQNIKLIIQEISKDESVLRLAEAEKALSEMEKAGFNTDEVNKLLEQAKNKLSESRNKEAQVLSNTIIGIKDKSFGVNNLMRRIIETLKNPKESYLLTGNVVESFQSEDNNVPLRSLMTGKMIFTSNAIKDTLNMALAAFERGDYATAEERAVSAQSLLLLERKGSFGLFLYLYWQFILIGAVIFCTFGILGYKQYQKSSITKKIEYMNKEEKNIRDLIRTSQRDYFEGKMSSGNYHHIMDLHEDKLAQIRKFRITLRNKRVRMLKPLQILEDLKMERFRVEYEIKKLQGEFYRDRTISENEYDEHFKILNERLAEIEQEKITLELLKKREVKISAK